MPPESTPGGVSWLRGGPKALIMFAIVLGLVLASFAFFSRQGLFRIYPLKQERTRLEAENARLAEENTRLSCTIDRLHHDPEMIQDLIRRELNFIKKNEIIIQLRPAVGTAKAAGMPAETEALRLKAPGQAKGQEKNGSRAPDRTP